MKIKNFYNIVVLAFLFFMLYLFQGFVCGIAGALQLNLKESGVTYAQQAILNLASSACYLKVIFGPFTDIYYLPKLGKRLTYIIIGGFILGIYSLYTSLNIQRWMDERAVTKILFLQFSMKVLVWTKDMVINSLGTEYLKRDHVQYAVVMKTQAQGVGQIMTSNVFIQFSSEKFVKDYFGLDKPQLNFETMFWIFSIWAFISIICAYIFIDEPNQKQVKEAQGEEIDEDNSNSVYEIFEMMAYTLVNPHWLLFIGGVYLNRMGNAFFEQTFTLHLIENPAYDKSIFAKADTLFFPFSLIAMLSITLIPLNYKPQTILRYANLARFINNVILWLFSVFFPVKEYVEWYGTARFLWLFLNQSHHQEFSAQVYFYSCYSDYRFKSSCMCALACCFNQSWQQWSFVYFYILDYVEYDKLAFFVVVLTSIFLFLVYPRWLSKLEKLSEEDFKCMEYANIKERSSRRIMSRRELSNQQKQIDKEKKD